MKKSRILACLLALTLLLGLLPLSAMAEGTFGWRFVMYDGDNRPYCNPEDPLQTEINLEPGISHHMGFFLDGAFCTPSAISVEDEKIASVSTLEEGNGQYYCVEALAFGDTELHVTVGDADYELPISVALPSSGFSSSETFTEDTYLSSFTFTKDNRSFYFVAEDVIPSDQVTLTMYNVPTADVTWKIISNCVIQLTVSDAAAFSEAWLNLEITWAEGGTRYYSLRLVNGTPRLVFCPVDWDGNGYALPETLWAYEGGLAPGQTLAGVFGVMTGSEIALISAPSVTVEGENISIGQAGTASEFPVYLLECRSMGQAQLQVGEYTLAISVELPAYGFYTSRNRSEETYLNQCNYFENSTLWLLTEDGFLEEQKETVTVSAEGREPQIEWVARANGSYDLKITLPAPTDSRDDYTMEVWEENFYLASIWVSAQPQSSAYYLTHGGKQFAVGFVSSDECSGWSVMDGSNSFGLSLEYGDTRREWSSFPVLVGQQKTDEAGGIYYETVTSGEVTAQVTKLTLQPIFGAENAFSWSATEDILETTDPDAVLYLRTGADATARILADVEVTVNGSTTTQRVSVLVELHQQKILELNWTEIDDTDALNQALASLLTEQVTDDDTMIQIQLGNHTFQGTVVIPNLNWGGRELVLQGNGTTIQGSLNLNHQGILVRSIESIAFVRDTQSGSTAIYGGTCGSILDCSFTGYDIALASNQDGNLNPIRCTFVDNNIAASVDVANLQWNMSLNPWDGNLFQNNGTAVKIESFNDFLSPYYFRVTNSDFIDNGVDFDVDCAATLYFYQNFYGTTKGSVEDAKHTPPTVECDHSITKVITNPRWKAPVLAWENRAVTFSLLAEPVKANYLTADWDLPTEIVNEEADGLTLDAAAFREPGEKTIDVVNQQQQYLGTWTFDGVSTVESGVFHAGLAVEQGETAITVTVRESEMLDAVPTLSVPCVFAYAQVRCDGKTVEAAIKDGKITFPVAAAGTYTITEAEAPAQVPETPKPSKPEISQEPETPAFSDVPVGAWYEKAVAYVAGQGILQGTGNGKFSPDANLTRGMMMTILARMAGVDTTGGKTWYEKALAWAVEQGISDGTHPEATITREQLATMLHRFAGEPAAEGDLSAFTDDKTVSPWAKEAVAWAVKAGILQGSGGKLRPQATATRAETAQLLWKYCTAFDL